MQSEQSGTCEVVVHPTLQAAGAVGFCIACCMFCIFDTASWATLCDGVLFLAP